MRGFKFLLISMVFSILVTSIIVFFEMAHDIYIVYENNFLDGYYQGETKAKYYIEFLFVFLFPAIWLLCVFFMIILSKFRRH